MEITFSDRKLEKLVHEERKLRKAYGDFRADKILLRLNALRIAAHLAETRHLPGRFHELRDDRKGQRACDLDHPYRLLFVPHEDPIPTNGDGQYLWEEIRGVEIIGVIDYH